MTVDYTNHKTHQIREHEVTKFNIMIQNESSVINLLQIIFKFKYEYALGSKESRGLSDMWKYRSTRS